MGYWTYYLVLFFLSWALRYPWLAGGAVVLFLLRRFIPDPVVWLRTSGRMRSLRAAILANPSNVTARRDLARIYLQRLRPRAALRLLDEARTRHPDDAELLYLTALARFRSGDGDGAIPAIVRAVEIQPRLLFGEPYLLAGNVLTSLGKLHEAEDSYERYVDQNSSSIEGHLKLAKARKALHDGDGARRALGEALSTWSQLPGFRKRRDFGWWIRAQIARLYV